MPAKLRLISLESVVRPRQSQICAQCVHRARIQTRQLSSSLSRKEQDTRPRWSYTPERMKAPVPTTFNNKEDIWPVNESPERLDEFYVKLLGEGGDSLLTEEVKWLAVTHKTFDQGRRGYNDRLAFLGKRILNLQSSLALLNRTDGTFTYPPDQHDREPFQHPGVDLLPRLTITSREFVINQKRIADLATRYGMLRIMRWKPRMIKDLAASGVDSVLATGIYAIIGALALQRGGEIATRLVQERILPEIGLPQQDE